MFSPLRRRRQANYATPFHFTIGTRFADREVLAKLSLRNRIERNKGAFGMLAATVNVPRSTTAAVVFAQECGAVQAGEEHGLVVALNCQPLVHLQFAFAVDIGV